MTRNAKQYSQHHRSTAPMSRGFGDRAPSQTARHLGSRIEEKRKELLDATTGESEGRAREAERGGHLALNVPDRGCDRGEPDLQLVDRGGVALFAHLSLI